MASARVAITAFLVLLAVSSAHSRPLGKLSRTLLPRRRAVDSVRLEATEQGETQYGSYLAEDAEAWADERHMRAQTWATKLIETKTPTVGLECEDHRSTIRQCYRTSEYFELAEPVQECTHFAFCRSSMAKGYHDGLIDKPEFPAETYLVFYKPNPKPKPTGKGKRSYQPVEPEPTIAYLATRCGNTGTDGEMACETKKNVIKYAPEKTQDFKKALLAANAATQDSLLTAENTYGEVIYKSSNKGAFPFFSVTMDGNSFGNKSTGKVPIVENVGAPVADAEELKRQHQGMKHWNKVGTSAKEAVSLWGRVQAMCKDAKLTPEECPTVSSFKPKSRHHFILRAHPDRFGKKFDDHFQGFQVNTALPIEVVMSPDYLLFFTDEPLAKGSPLTKRKMMSRAQQAAEAFGVKHKLGCEGKAFMALWFFVGTLYGAKNPHLPQKNYFESLNKCDLFCEDEEGNQYHLIEHINKADLDKLKTALSFKISTKGLHEITANAADDNKKDLAEFLVATGYKKTIADKIAAQMVDQLQGDQYTTQVGKRIPIVKIGEGDAVKTGCVFEARLGSHPFNKLAYEGTGADIMKAVNDLAAKGCPAPKQG